MKKTFLSILLLLAIAPGLWAFPPSPPSSGGSPAGASGSVQCNNAGAFGACSNVTDAAIPTAASLHVDDIITLSGMPEGSQHLGSLSGSTVPDNQTVKAAIQALETAVEGKAAVNASTTGSAGSLLSPASELTIASDAITVTGGAHTVDTQEDAASDDLVTINGGADGKVVFLRAAHTDRTVILKETGNIVLTHGTTLTLDSTGRWVMLYYDGNLSKWVCDALTDTLSLSSIAGAAITPAEVDGHTTSTDLTAAQVSNTVIHNYDQAASDVFLIAPAAAAGYSALFNVVTAQANHWCFEAAANDKIYLIAAAGTVAAGDDGAAVCMMAAQLGQSFACWTFKSGASSYDWMCKAIAIGTSTFEAHASSE